MKRLAGKSTRNKEEVSQTINLESALGVDLSDNPRLVNQIGQAFVDRIRERTEENKDVSGRNFTSYSKEYVESDEFEDFNKSASDINLELTGRMLDSLDFSTSGNNITIEVPSDEAGKAFGNISGIRGKSNKRVNPRDWFGLSAKDIQDIKSDFSSELDRVKQRGQTEREQTLSALDLLTQQSVQQQSAESVFNELFTASFSEDFDIGSLF